MLPGRKRLGRPKSDEEAGEMRKVTFRIDAETETALAALEAQLDQGILRGRRSALLRRLVLAEFKKLSD